MLQNAKSDSILRISEYWHSICVITSKINVTPKGVYLPISKLHSIIAVANLLAHNNKSQICYCGQISLQSAAVNWSFSDIFVGTIYFAGDGTMSPTVQTVPRLAQWALKGKSGTAPHCAIPAQLHTIVQNRAVLCLWWADWEATG